MRRSIMIKHLYSALAGFVLAAILGFVLFLNQSIQASIAVANAQGKVDVMQNYCRTELEKVGIVKAKAK